MDINWSGPPLYTQLLGLTVFVMSNWILGFVFQYTIRQYKLIDEKPFPVWIRWLCGIFNPRHAINDRIAYAQLLALPEILLGVLLFFLMPTALLFILSCALIFFCHYVLLYYILKRR